MTAVLPRRTVRPRARRVTADPPGWPAVPTVGGPWQARTKREAQALAVGYTAGLVAAQRDVAEAYWRGRESLAAEIMPAIRWAWATTSPGAQLAAWREVQETPWADIRDRHLRAVDAVTNRRRYDTTTGVPRPGDRAGREAA